MSVNLAIVTITVTSVSMMRKWLRDGNLLTYQAAMRVEVFVKTAATTPKESTAKSASLDTTVAVGCHQMPGMLVHPVPATRHSQLVIVRMEQDSVFAVQSMLARDVTSAMLDTLAGHVVRSASVMLMAPWDRCVRSVEASAPANPTMKDRTVTDVHMATMASRTVNHVDATV